ncbi:MAG: Sigma-70 family RNA polymerase sigma factor [Xylanivirga thermophila]|jgi:hypothetical protein|uniref:hypothetical protein n=1 Tax=Xylanivirga thermophila TaxID=2496273 RepID=UPI0039F561E2
MKNYQRVNYRKYYAQDENGNYVEVDRKTCFASSEPPTEDNPYKQRWFYDEEAGYVVRLSRTKESEDIHRFNSSSLKREERYRNRKFSCIWEKTKNCDQNCEQCNRKNKSRTVELDKTWTGNDDEMESSFTPIDTSQNVLKIIEDKELMAALLVAYDGLSSEDKLLFNALINKEKKKVIAEKLNITVDGVRYRELQLRKKLLAHKDLKDVLEK